MLNKHGRVYLKPEWGSNGRGISRVWKDGNDSCGWAGAVSGQSKTGCTIEQVAELINQEAGGDILVIQQEIPLFEIKGRRSDMRLGVREDLSGQWCFDPARTRMMKPGGITTNWARGAAWSLFPEGLSYYVRDGVDAEQL